MPMARPIMVIMLVMKNDKSMNWPTTAVIPMAKRMDASAIIRGTAAVTMAPNTSTRMIRAIPTPKISPVRRSLSAVAPKSALMLASPVTSTSKSEAPAAERAAAVRDSAFSRALPSEGAMLKSERTACRSSETSTGEASLV